MRDTKIDAIVGSGAVGMAFRVLSVDLDWPAGEPPHVEQAVTAPEIPPAPPVYAPATFDPAVWTDVTGLVSEYHYTQDSGYGCDQLSLSVPVEWRQSDLARVFREMRVLVVQERFRGAGQDTGWINRCWCLSDGYAESWEGGMHRYTVNAKDALKLANLEILGGRTGSAVYQADLISIGSLSAHAPLQLVQTASDAFEYGVTADGETDGPIQPNWADRPAPQFWCTNARDRNGDPWPDPVPLTIGGDAVQAVFGEGIVRVGISWARSTSEDAVSHTTDFSLGLGLGAEEAPVIEGVLSRFAHAEVSDRHEAEVPSDVYDDLHVASSSAGEVVLSSPVPSWGLSLLLQDGSGRRYRTRSDAGTVTHTLTLLDAAAVIPAGAAVTYGDANRLVTVVTRLLLDCGYQMSDATGPLYLHTPAAPVINGVATDIALPPLVFQDTEGVTAFEALESLRRDGYVPPNWYVRADAGGQVRAGSMHALPAGHAGVIPLPAMTALDYQRSDLGVATRVVARGLVRQVADVADRGSCAVSIAEVAAVDGGLPAVPAGLKALAVRAGATGDSYAFGLDTLLTRGLPSTTRNKELRPWAWWYQGTLTSAADADAELALARGYRDSWSGAALCEITLEGAARIEALELWALCPWWTNDTGDWGKGKRTKTPGISFGGVKGPYVMEDGHADPQTLAVDYLEASSGQFLPLATGMVCPITDQSSEMVQRVEAAEFVTRAAVETTALRIRVEQPFFAEFGGHNHGEYNAVIAAWLWQVKLWTSPELRAVAELGVTAPFDTATWQAVRQRVRSRTYVLPEAVSWAGDDATVQWLALEWLKEKTRDLAPRRVSVVRPDVRLWDTVSFTTPAGDAGTYLVVGTDHTQAGVATLTCVDYANPYFEEEG